MFNATNPGTTPSAPGSTTPGVAEGPTPGTAYSFYPSAAPDPFYPPVAPAPVPDYPLPPFAPSATPGPVQYHKPMTNEATAPGIYSRSPLDEPPNSYDEDEPSEDTIEFIAYPIIAYHKRTKLVIKGTLVTIRFVPSVYDDPLEAILYMTCTSMDLVLLHVETPQTTCVHTPHIPYGSKNPFKDSLCKGFLHTAETWDPYSSLKPKNYLGDDFLDKWAHYR